MTANLWGYNAPLNIPLGLCGCGCGEIPTIARTSDPTRGRVKGQPLRFVLGHQHRKLVQYRVSPTGYFSPCWIWQLAKSRDGYGHYKPVPGRCLMAHRLYYEQAHGPLPSHLQLDHLCRVRACVNPDHLEPVTPRQNVRRGSGTKLSFLDVLEIRTSSEKQVVLARRFGVSQSQISRIKTRASWQRPD